MRSPRILRIPRGSAWHVRCTARPAMTSAVSRTLPFPVPARESGGDHPSRSDVARSFDRAMLGATILHRGVKLDDQVHIGHNCDVGEYTRLCAQVGIGGSTKIGKWCLFGGQAAAPDHLTIGDRVMVAARGALHRDTPDGAIMAPIFGWFYWRQSWRLARCHHATSRRLRQRDYGDVVIGRRKPRGEWLFCGDARGDYVRDQRCGPAARYFELRRVPYSVTTIGLPLGLLPAGTWLRMGAK